MEDKDFLAKQLALKAGKEIFDSMRTSDPKRKEWADMLFLLMLSAALLVLGSQAMLVLFRTNFGQKVIKKWAITLSSLSFIGWGWLTFLLAFYTSSEVDLAILGGEIGCYFTSVFYVAFGVLIYFIGNNEIKKSNLLELPPYFRGDSVLLGFIDKTGNNQGYIQKVAEPLILLSLGVFFSAFSYMLCLPVFYCLISLIAHNFFYGVQLKSISAIVFGMKEAESKDTDFSTITY